MYGIRVDRGEIVICYSDIKPLTVVVMDPIDLSAYFSVFNARIRHFQDQVGDHIRDQKPAIQKEAEKMVRYSHLHSFALVVVLILIYLYF